MTFTIPIWVLWTLGGFGLLLLSFILGAALVFWLFCDASGIGVGRGLHW